MTTTTPYLPSYDTRRALACLSILPLTLDPDPSCEDEPCDAFGFCVRPAIGWVNVPLFGDLRYCGRCAAVSALEMHYRCARCQSLAHPSQALTSYVCGERPDDGVECHACATDHEGNCDACWSEIRRSED
jgi:hypothetical protein